MQLENNHLNFNMLDVFFLTKLVYYTIYCTSYDCK